MTAGEERHIIQALQEFIQRELDLLRKLIDDARQEAAEDHREVKQRLGNVESSQAAMTDRVARLETHEEAIAARAEGIESERSSRRRHVAQLVAGAAAAAGVAGMVAGIVFALIDRI